MDKGVGDRHQHPGLNPLDGLEAREVDNLAGLAHRVVAGETGIDGAPRFSECIVCLRYLRWAVGTWFSLKLLVVMFRYMLEFVRPVLCLRTSFWGTAGIRHKHRFR